MKYKTIVIDPPWNLASFNAKPFSHSHTSDPELPYERMSDKEIAEFPINNFADDECDLFLWTTKAKLHVAFHILEKWGFHYANILVWNKLNGINHNGVHGTLEFVLYGYKTKNGLNYYKPIESYYEAKRRKHSQKPDLFYSSILKVTPAPRIDIFARKRHYGFDAYGDQVETQIQQPLLIASLDDKAIKP